MEEGVPFLVLATLPCLLTATAFCDGFFLFLNRDFCAIQCRRQARADLCCTTLVWPMEGCGPSRNFRQHLRSMLRSLEGNCKGGSGCATAPCSAAAQRSVQICLYRSVYRSLNCLQCRSPSSSRFVHRDCDRPSAETSSTGCLRVHQIPQDPREYQARLLHLTRVTWRLRRACALQSKPVA